MKILFFTDLHLVGKSNSNRKDNLVETQIKKMNEIIRLSENFDIVLSCGDIFHKHDPTISTMNNFSQFLKELKKPLILCAGNHDLHGYNYDSIHNTGLGYVCSFFKEKVTLMNEDMSSILIDDVSIHFKRTTDKNPMTGFIVDRSKSKHHIGIIHDMVYYKDFFGESTIYGDFESNLDIVFNGHIHPGHEPFFINETWFVNCGSVTRMHKPKPLFMPRYSVVEINDSDIVCSNHVFQEAQEDVFNIHEKKEFNDFIQQIESKSIESNAIDYMFLNADKKLSKEAYSLLNDVYKEVA